MAIVGIDLGTTYCAVAHLDDRGRPTTLPNRDGEILTPSAVYLAEDGSAVVGQPALDMALEQPERVATLIKRRMGLPDFGRPVAGRDFRPETLSAVLLRKLILDAETHVGPVRQAVITVPAYFDDSRRKATQDAGRIAGLDVLDILDEPSAAALAYTVQTGMSGIPGMSGVGPDARTPDTPANPTVLVYDLGGGTFDVTLVKLGKKRFQVLTIEGDVRLGGRDFDERVVRFVADQFRHKFGTDPQDDPQSAAMLYAAAERAKRTLSKVPSTTVTAAHAGHKLSVPLTRERFDELTRDLLLRTRLTTQQVVQQAGLTWPQVDKVLMVGGSTHMPMTGQMLAELAGREPDRSLAVSEVVARGAAVHAGIVTARLVRAAGQAAAGPLADVVEVSVNAHSLGVEVRQGDDRLNNKLIPKNTQLPAAASRVYFTLRDGASKVRVRVLQGEAPKAEACIPVGEVWVDGLPPDLPKGSPVQVRCEVGANGRIGVMALDMTSGRLAQADIHRTGGLTDAEVEAEAAWVRGLEVR
jgi:molecular chaperone DnaK